MNYAKQEDLDGNPDSVNYLARRFRTLDSQRRIDGLRNMLGLAMDRYGDGWSEETWRLWQEVIGEHLASEERKAA